MSPAVTSNAENGKVERLPPNVNSSYLAGRKRAYEGLRLAGVPER
jgi:hypothetical protein